ncbi:valine--tRNA ligase [Longirhabdus pacifica]|uniref:valine--tRNA ligase n=1 Tax=Longirhabdus pacifica TaxID=2305227 RepID=UPI0010089E2C|nr:valine--tRNA ligase [Longirhabdus pacifica]
MKEQNQQPSISMSTTYDPKSIEEKWNTFWHDGKYFEAGKRPDAETFTVVIPPPNVTGMLHIGHAQDCSMQDLIIRTKRMQGFDTLWLPGTDHAGIATQAKVEQKLKEEGINKYDLGREKFLEQVWDWKEKYSESIHEQWRKLGLSLDYSRERFTLDEGLSRAVREVFVKLYEKGLIYRGNYIINWDPQARTALSDIEVIYKEVQGKLYHLKYPIKDSDEFLTVATTRPETMLGDTAVAVHPKDERYQHLIGKTIILPITGREIPIVGDSYVEKEFGSGAVKITPAHDPNDFEIGLRHDLPQILVMDESGTMNENAASYNGMDRFECRKQIIADLKEQGVLIQIEEHTHQVGHSERTNAVVEPYLSTQWFVKMKPLADRAIEAQKNEDGVNFVPQRFEKIYLGWIENIRDWCISRQLWWGHRIPAWHCADCGEITVSQEEASTCKHCNSSNLKQDEDVLDTWFSSALWPFSTLGWPEETEDMKRFYPTSVLSTGYDIIFFWVARMIFTALEFTDQPPFKDVLIHGLVRDAEGRKMSKSLGNGVDPSEVIEKYGTDAMRFMLLTGTTPGQDLKFHWDKVEQARNFANKIWNASRFVLMNMGEFRYEDIDLSGPLETADKWILHRLNVTIEEVTRLLDRYEFGEVGRILYNFIWDDLCDWYIEFAKINLYGDNETAKATTMSVLSYTLEQTMKLMHPFMPYISEEIWQHLPHQGETITVAPWPEQNEQFHYAEAAEQMELLMDIIRTVRNIRAEVKAPMSRKVNMKMNVSDEALLSTIKENQHLIEYFCGTASLQIGTDIKPTEQVMTGVVTGVEMYLPLAGLVDVEQEIERLEKEWTTLNKEVERVEKKLGNEGFVAKAPQHVIDAEKEKQIDYTMKREKVTQRLEEMKKLRS